MAVKIIWTKTASSKEEKFYITGKKEINQQLIQKNYLLKYQKEFNF